MGALLIPQLQEIVPSAFADSPISRASERYKMVRTMDLVEGLMNNGWEVTSAKELKTTSKEKYGHQFHVLKMENPSLFLGDGEKFQVVISNGADLVTPLQIQAGIFRLVCSNGLVAGRNFIPPVKLSHVGSIREVVSQTMDQLPSLLEKVGDSVNLMKQAPITQSQAEQLAQKAYFLRHNKEASEITIADLINPRREVDKSPDLWTRFNVIQENILNGYYKYPVAKSNQTVALYASSKVESVKKDLLLNQALFDEAMSIVA